MAERERKSEDRHMSETTAMEKKLTEIREIETAINISTALGLRYVGIQRGLTGVQDHALMTDRKTGSTIGVLLSELTLGHAEEILAASRKKFNVGEKP